MSKIGLSGSIETFIRASDPPGALRAPIIFWTLAFGPAPIGVQESRTRPWTARPTLIWEIPDHTNRGRPSILPTGSPVRPPSESVISERDLVHTPESRHQGAARTISEHRFALFWRWVMSKKYIVAITALTLVFLGVSYVTVQGQATRGPGREADKQAIDR